MGQEIHEELLFATTLTTSIKCKSIFNVLRLFHEKSDPFIKYHIMSADGVPVTFGRGFISHLKQNVPGVFAIHCVIHRQHLVTKKLIASISSIRPKRSSKTWSNALNSTLFAQLCEKMTTTFIDYSFTLKYTGCQKAFV